MSYRGWHEPDTHPLEDFICGFLGGATGFFNFPDWLLVYFGWVGGGTVLLLCAGVGLLLGTWLAYENMKENRPS